MTCERYWRDGIVLVERGLADPHRDGCEACKRAHASRQELVDALPMVGAGSTGDPHWQAKVWRRIREPAPRAARAWPWQLAGAFAAACAIVLWVGLGRPPPDDDRVAIEIVRRDVATRALATDLEAHVGDSLRVRPGKRADVWIYRGDRLELACRARTPSTGCALASHGMVVDLRLSASGSYRVFVVEVSGALVPKGVLDEDRATLESAGLAYQERRLSVR